MSIKNEKLLGFIRGMCYTLLKINIQKEKKHEYHESDPVN